MVRRLVVQEEGMGCGLACVASELGIRYQTARKLSGRPDGSFKNGYYCQDLVMMSQVSHTNHTL